MKLKFSFMKISTRDLRTKGKNVFSWKHFYKTEIKNLNKKFKGKILNKD